MTTHIPNLVIHVVNSSNQILEADGVASTFTREPTATVQFVAGNGKIIETDFAAGSADGRLPNGAAVVVDSTNRIIESDGSQGPFRQASIAVRQVGSGALASMVLRIVDSSNVVLDRLFGSALEAPVLTWVSGVTDNLPNFSIDWPDGFVVGTDYELEISDDIGFGGSPDEEILGDGDDDPTLVEATIPLADGTWYARARYTGSAWSNVETKTIDATAPTVSSFSPADNATDIAVDFDLVVTFSEPIVLGASGTITLKKTSDDTTVDSWDVSADEGSGAGQLEVLNDNELHLHLTTSITGGLECYVVWGAGVVEDAVGNPVAALSTTTTWSFTTISAWTPADLTPDLWIEPAQGGLFQSNAGSTAATANSDVVGYAPDLSGDGFHLTSAADDTTRPTLQGVGALPYLSFDGSNDILRRTASLGSYAAGAATWGIVFRSNSNAVNSYLLAEGSSAGANMILGNVIASATATVQTMFWRNDANGQVIATAFVPNAGVFDGTDRVLIITDNGSTITTYVDGVAGATSAYTRSGAFTPDRFALGGLVRNTTGSWWAGRVYGLVAVNRVVSAGERADLTTYLGNLAGLSL
jgi:hypothetical protein